MLPNLKGSSQFQSTPAVAPVTASVGVETTIQNRKCYYVSSRDDGQRTKNDMRAFVYSVGGAAVASIFLYIRYVHEAYYVSGNSTVSSICLLRIIKVETLNNIG